MPKALKTRPTKPQSGSGRTAKRTAPYHHGDLRSALLDAAERILVRDGIQGLTLRAAAREAGVSHAAPKNHFGDLRGLLSDLAAVGFERLGAAMTAGLSEATSPDARMAAIGRGYVTFARREPALFLLMFRGERLDFERPTLRAATRASLGILSGSIGARRAEEIQPALSLDQAAAIAAAWSLVHGLALLLIDGRLSSILARLPAGTDEGALLAAVFERARPTR